jgi:hypothetical protein
MTPRKPDTSIRGPEIDRKTQATLHAVQRAKYGGTGCADFCRYPRLRYVPPDYSHFLVKGEAQVVRKRGIETTLTTSNSVKVNLGHPYFMASCHISDFLRQSPNPHHSLSPSRLRSKYLISVLRSERPPIWIASNIPFDHFR